MPLNVVKEEAEPIISEESKSVQGKEAVNELIAKKTTRRKAAPKVEVSAISLEELNKKIQKLRSQGRRFCLAVDPGARYTAISIRDDRGEVYLSSTYYRADDTTGDEWGWECADYVEDMLGIFEVDVLALEAVVDPTGFNHGKKAALNPKDIIRTALVVGSISYKYKDRIIMVRPRKNGSAVEEDFYPKCLEGRRPKDLCGFKDPKVKTRQHEKSAYDVAGQALFMTRKD